MDPIAGGRVKWIAETRSGGEQTMGRTVNPDALRRAVERSTRSSAALERRTVPVGHVRSEKVRRFLEARHAA
jgi:hypothetical protein